MKNTFKIVLALFMVAGLWSCESEDNFMLAEPIEGDFMFLTPDAGSSIVITEETPETNTAVTFTWQGVAYTTPTSVNYTVEAVANGGDFSASTELTTVPGTVYAMTYAELNALANALDPLPGEDGAVAIDLRVKATIGTTGSEPVYSDVLTIAVTPFLAPVALPELFIVGSSTDNGWNNNDANQPMFRNENDENKYMITAYFAVGQLKFVRTRGQWAPQWGGGAGTLVPRPTESEPDPSPLEITTAGYYTVEVDLTTLTYTITPYNAAGAPTFTSVGVIGAGTPGGWDADTVMTNTATNPHLWRVTGGTTITPASTKFRANGSWDLPGNWGAGTAPYSGQASVNGGDFTPVEQAGQYDVYFNDLDGRYLFISVE